MGENVFLCIVSLCDWALLHLFLSSSPIPHMSKLHRTVGAEQSHFHTLTPGRLPLMWKDGRNSFFPWLQPRLSNFSKSAEIWLFLTSSAFFFFFFCSFSQFFQISCGKSLLPSWTPLRFKFTPSYHLWPWRLMLYITAWIPLQCCYKRFKCDQ